MKEENRELTLEELELICGGFDYVGFYEYRAEILNNFKLKDLKGDYLLAKGDLSDER